MNRLIAVILVLLTIGRAEIVRAEPLDEAKDALLHFPWSLEVDGKPAPAYAHYLANGQLKNPFGGSSYTWKVTGPREFVVVNATGEKATFLLNDECTHFEGLNHQHKRVVGNRMAAGETAPPKAGQ